MESRMELFTCILTVHVILFGTFVDSLPYLRGTEILSDKCDHSRSHVFVVNSTDGTIINCIECHQCPGGYGLSMPCNGQNVSKAELNLGCENCVAGVNYSTEEFVQCQPCVSRICPSGMKTEGKCEADGDKRSCKNCKYKNWYYNDTLDTCQPCSCRNMTLKIKQICRRLGFDHDTQCDAAASTPSSPGKAQRNIWDANYIYAIAFIVCLGAIVFIITYICCVARRISKMKLSYPSLTACSKQWFCKIFFFKEPSRSCPPSSSSTKDSHAQNGFGGNRAPYIRQSSCPVTQCERFWVNQDEHAPLVNQESIKLIGIQECPKKTLQFVQINSEVSRKTCRALMENVELGKGYPTLAGLMSFTHEDVKGFEASGKPCKSMLECWSNMDKGNTVLKLREFVVQMKRADIVDLLDQGLHLHAKELKCNCSECAVRV